MSEAQFDRICAERGPSWESQFRVHYAMVMPNLQHMHYTAVIKTMEAKTPEDAASYRCHSQSIGKAIKRLEDIYAGIKAEQRK